MKVLCLKYCVRIHTIEDIFMARNWKKEGISRAIVPFWITGPQIEGSTTQKTTKFKQL